MMIGWAIKNRNGDLAIGTSIYRTERGAKLGKKAFIERSLQEEYILQDGEGLDYGHFHDWLGAKLKDPWPSIDPSTPEEIAAVEEKAQNMEEEWQVSEVSIA